jgi:uncharacterized membrane protein YsdA (DUF1294 family)
MASSPQPPEPAPPGKRGRLGLRHFVVLLLLLIAPGLALHRLSAQLHIHFQWLLAYSVVISLVTYAVYGADKDSAEDRTSRWRAPEKLLHGLEFAGGWPGAFLAQRLLRHKCSKFSYQLVFWAIVFLHVGAAIDYRLDWRVSRAAWHRVFPSTPPPGHP